MYKPLSSAAMMMELSPKQKSLLTLLALIIIFAVPMIAAKILYTSGTHEFATTNQGELISPPLQFSHLELTDTKNVVFPKSMLLGKWVLVYLTPVSCDKLCAQNLYDMRQVRLALGKDQDRLQRLLLTYPDTVNRTLEKTLSQQYAGTYLAVVTPKATESFFGSSLFNAVSTEQGGLFVVDPLGNVMMHYSPNTDPEMTLKDLTKLLRVSQIG